MCRRRRGECPCSSRGRERALSTGRVHATRFHARADPDSLAHAVKCSREIPSCSNCAKRGEECSLSEPQQEGAVSLAPPAKKAKKQAGDEAKEMLNNAAGRLTRPSERRRG